MNPPQAKSISKNKAAILQSQDADYLWRSGYSKDEKVIKRSVYQKYTQQTHVHENEALSKWLLPWIGSMWRWGAGSKKFFNKKQRASSKIQQ